MKVVGKSTNYMERPWQIGLSVLNERYRTDQIKVVGWMSGK